jgi:plastocyanin
VQTPNLHYNGVSYYNSGFLTTFAAAFPGAYLTYGLTFDVTGVFTYYCTVHPEMKAKVHVRRAGTEYPHSQSYYNRIIRNTTDAIMDRGAELLDTASDKATSHHGIVGDSAGDASLMRFFPTVAHIEVGDTITFTNRDMMEPHTVTFGALPTGFNDFFPIGNPTNFTGVGPRSSGFIGMNPGWNGDTFTVTFTTTGKFTFYCDLHDYLGMVMTVDVEA